MAPAGKTYAQALQPVQTSPSVDLIPEIASHKGEIAIRFSKEQIDCLASPFQYALIGKFSQGKPKLDAIKRFLEVQNYTEQYTVGVLDSKHVLINFSGERDFIRLYSRSQWFVTSKPMRILKWTPYFHVDVESSIVPAWILLPKLPAHLMKLEALKGIISSFGKLLRIDASTASLKRPSTARVQIEADLLKPFPRRFWIQQGDTSGFWQFVELETALPKYCTYCCHIGHTEDDCRLKHPQQFQQHDPPSQQQQSPSDQEPGSRKNRPDGPPAQIWRQKQTSTFVPDLNQQPATAIPDLNQQPQPQQEPSCHLSGTSSTAHPQDSSQLEGDRTLGEQQNQLSHYTQHFNPLSNSPPHVELEGLATTSISSSLEVNQMVTKRNEEVDLAIITKATELDNVASKCNQMQVQMSELQASPAAPNATSSCFFSFKKLETRLCESQNASIK